MQNKTSMEWNQDSNIYCCNFVNFSILEGKKSRQTFLGQKYIWIEKFVIQKQDKYTLKPGDLDLSQQLC